jgi:hypothetical protein
MWDTGSNVNLKRKSDTDKAARFEATFHLDSKVNCHSAAKFQEILTIMNHEWTPPKWTFLTNFTSQITLS